MPRLSPPRRPDLRRRRGVVDALVLDHVTDGEAHHIAHPRPVSAKSLMISPIRCGVLGKGAMAVTVSPSERAQDRKPLIVRRRTRPSGRAAPRPFEVRPMGR
jgi:hypothetical protein